MLNDDQGKIYIAWDSKFDLGIPVIDNQHKKLVNLCNNLYEALMKNKTEGDSTWQSSFTATLKECVDYVKTHFHDEEVIMQAAGYANYASHKKSHEDFIYKILETTKEFDKATFTTALQFVRFLYDWILRHVAHEDKLYVKRVLEYYRERQSQK
ncbi:MAG: hemerythrin family protein [Spirochaetales bacterium]|nr:hemerythrin family protein [Spirochaetales bacterium]